MWILLLLLAVTVAGILVYNGLVRLREQVDSAWADIDVQLKRRHDLVPNLVETVKAYALHEKDTLETVVRARSAALSADGPAERGEAENRLAGALRSLFALSESYPDLRANESFLGLQDSLSDLEDHLQRARRYYNAVVRDYNTRVRQVPTNLVAGAFGFRAREFFQAERGARAVPEVRLASEEAQPDG
jgi:LemA protein